MEDNYTLLIPILSDGLEFNKLTEKEYILCNQAYKHYLKINCEVYDIIKLIDGKTNFKIITSKFSDKTGKEISVEYVYKLIYENLTKYGILKGFDNYVIPYKKPEYLNLSFTIFNDRILAKFVKFFYFLFNKRVAIIALFFSLTLILTLLSLNIDLYKSFNLQESLIYFVIVMVFSVTFHEIGHATSASFFGAKHGGIGGGFYLFTPVYYADVTDIWRLSKTQRVIVNLSGMYFELIFCTFLAISSFIFNQELLMIISIFVCLHSLFNLNPFLRSDGFWILSDLTNKPNLFLHSSEKVKDLFRFIHGKKVIWSRLDFFLFLYGLSNLILIALFLYYVLFQNTNSIIFFPKNLLTFFSSLANDNSETSVISIGRLIVPGIFYLMLFNLIKPMIRKLWLKIK